MGLVVSETGSFFILLPALSYCLATTTTTTCVLLLLGAARINISTLRKKKTFGLILNVAAYLCKFYAWKTTVVVRVCSICYAFVL